MSYDDYKVGYLPEGEDGVWKVERFTVSKGEADWERLRSMFSGGGRGVPEGTYTRLTRNGEVIMSDTPDEIRDHLGAIRRASGRVLIHGLGLGMVARACLLKPEVEHVTVVDLSPSVVKLVGVPLMMKFGKGHCLLSNRGDVQIMESDNLRILTADAYTWKPEKGERWHIAWHDIWDNLCTDNLKEMAKLHRRFGRRVNWQDSWGKGLLTAQKRREDREERYLRW